MNAEIVKIEKILGTEFSMNNYVELIREIFSSAKIVAPYNNKWVDGKFYSYIAEYYHVANYETPDAKKLIIAAVKLKKESYVENARSKQRNYAKRLIENSNSDAAMVAFYTEGDSKWRLSFVRLDYKIKFENGRPEEVENITPAKRYSFLVGADEPMHTAIERLYLFITDKNARPTLDDLEEVFSVEKVTKEFFYLYCEKYHQLREYLLTNEDFLAESEKCGFSVEQFAKKLMGQIVFLYFLQKKGWLGVGVWPSSLTETEYKHVYYDPLGVQKRVIQEYLPRVYRKEGNKYLFQKGALSKEPNDVDKIPDEAEKYIANNLPQEKIKNWGEGSQHFLRTLFEYHQKHSKKGENFYNDYLEYLFYDALNKNRGPKGYFPRLHCRIPFLSGGLFEPINGYNWCVSNFYIPDEIFSNRVDNDPSTGDGILDIFDRYNFTMSEDEPMECEVAVDPEMLGKVFENLLDVTDRKSKGAFYTPREIVHYMCQESLINYLTTATGLSEPGIRDFILYGDFMKDEDTVTEKRLGNGVMFISEEIFKIDEEGNVVVNRLMDIDKALENIHIADPAVGSGAFPVGMLNEIVRARQTLTEYMAVVERSKAVSENQGNEFTRWLYQGRTAYHLKWLAIKNSIFAVDIEPSAIDIAQLRLWLSLVIDDEINPEAKSTWDGHCNPLPLPNLECNILCGNSLIDEFEGYPLLGINSEIGTEHEGDEYSWNQNELDVIISKILEIQDAIFSCNDPVEKPQLMEELDVLKDNAIETQLTYMEPEVRERYIKSKKLASKPYILWQLEFARVFRDKGGFDVVIGNPPYIGESGHKEIFREVADTEFGKRSYQGKMDFFYFFFHKGLDILHTNGELAFITTNYFPTATGAKRLRNDFKARTQIRALINFNEVRVFESALGQHNMITMLTKDLSKSISCKSVICNESITANADKIKQILYGADKENLSCVVAQENLYDGDEAYIRQTGVMSINNNLIGGVIDKMAVQPQHLGDFAEVNQGVISGCDTVVNRNIKYVSPSFNKIKGDGIFVFDLTNSRDIEVMESFGEGKELLRDFYKNSDISRYFCNTTATKKLLYYSDALDEEKYQDVLSHLRCFKELLERRLDNNNENYHWTALHRSRREDVFNNEKIVVPYRTRENAFAYNNTEWFCRTDVYVITPKTKEVDLFFLLGILNSKLTYIWLYNRGKRKGEILELFQTPLSEIPIASLSEMQKEEVANLARKITELKQENKEADTQKFESAIDDVLYKAYHLSDDEIKLVEENSCQ